MCWDLSTSSGECYFIPSAPVLPLLDNSLPGMKLELSSWRSIGSQIPIVLRPVCFYSSGLVWHFPRFFSCAKSRKPLWCSCRWLYKYMHARLSIKCFTGYLWISKQPASSCATSIYIFIKRIVPLNKHTRAKGMFFSCWVTEVKINCPKSESNRWETGLTAPWDTIQTFPEGKKKIILYATRMRITICSCTCICKYVIKPFCIQFKRLPCYHSGFKTGQNNDTSF